MESRGKKVLGLAKKRTPLSTLSLNLLPRPSFNLAMDKCERFLNNLRTPDDIRRMDPHELENLENMYDTDNNIVEVAQEALLYQDTNDVHDDAGGPVGSPQPCTSKKQVSGHVSFGPLGFMNQATDKDCNGKDSADIEEVHVACRGFFV